MTRLAGFSTSYLIRRYQELRLEGFRARDLLGRADFHTAASRIADELFTRDEAGDVEATKFITKEMAKF